MNVSLEKLPSLQETQQKIQIEKTRRWLIDFTKYTFPDYHVNWHHRSCAEKMDRFIAGEIKNLMVFMPPQHGKSEISSRRGPAKILGDNPDCKIGIVAYNHTIAAKFNRDVQRIISSPEYKEIYPETTLNYQNVRTQDTWLRNVDEFEIVGRRGSLVSAGVGGGLTSRKLDVAIMDDLYKDAEAAWSQTIRASVQDWYDTVLRTRLHNNSQQLIVFTRWHEEDLAGYLLRTEPDNWEVVFYEALKEKHHSPEDPRQAGEALWPEHLTREKLEQIRKNNPVVFDSLYQQNPTPKGGLLLPAGELKRFSLAQIKDTKPDGIASVCDVADEGEDSLCHPVGFLYGQDVYIVDITFTGDPIEVTQPRVAAQLDQYNVDRSRFESNNGGKGYAQKVQELIQGRTNISWRHTATNKHTRIVMKSGDIKERFYFLVDDEQDEEYKRYFYELTHYPKNGKVKHDDAMDGTTMLAEFVIDDTGDPIMFT